MRKALTRCGIVSSGLVLVMCTSTPKDQPEDTSKNKPDTDSASISDNDTSGSSDDTSGSSDDTSGSSDDMSEVDWGKQIGTTSEDTLSSVTVDADDNIWVVGTTSGVIGSKNLGGSDIFFIKYNTDGDELLKVQFGSEENDTAGRIACDGDDNIIIVGNTEGKMGEARIGSRDIFTAEFNSGGNLIWTAQYGTTEDDEADCLSIDNENSILVGGGTLGLLGETAMGSEDGILTKITQDGEVLWNRQFGTDQKEYAQGIAIDSEKNIYVVTNYYESSVSSIVKLSEAGEVITQKNIDNLDLLDIHITAGDEIYVSGVSGSNSNLLKLDSEFGTVWGKFFSSGSWSGEKEIVPIGDDVLATSGCMHWPDCYGFVRTYDLAGNLKNWVKIRKSFTTAINTTCGNFLAADSTGAIYHVGQTEEDLFGSNQGGAWDGFLAKISF